jgi:hypothetical protein
MPASTLPPNIYPNSPLAQVIRLIQAGVDTSVIMTYVTNSASTFNLDSDKIIYLRDLGLPNEVVTAMMQRDQQLRAQMVATTYQPPATTTITPEPATTEVVEAPPPAETVEQPQPVTVNYFYDTLSPYGLWVDVEGYGRCWRPSVCVYNPGWQPYCDHGRWVYTDCGWYWCSDYSWGWAPFHYGRWFRHARWGWCWAPDTMWGPSWVTWRYSSGYCGWAPLPPYATYRSGVGFFYRGNSVSFGFNWGLNESCYTFVPTMYFCDPHPRRHCVGPGQVSQIFNQTTIINNFNGDGHRLANRGIDPDRITSVTHAPIQPVAIRRTGSAPGHSPRGDELSRDGKSLVISGPPRPVTPTQNQPRPPAPGQPATSQPPARHQQVPVVTTHGPQDRGTYSAPTQRPSPPVNYSAPASTPSNPSHDNRVLPPRGREQQTWQSPRSEPRKSDAPVAVPPSNRDQSSAAGGSHHSTSSAAPAPSRPQNSQSSSSSSQPSPSRSSGSSQGQGSSGTSSGNSSGNASSHGPQR